MIVLGGTFDPVHNGHLHCGKVVSALFDGSQVRMMLAGKPNLKRTPIASIRHRWRMLELACESVPNLIPDDFELKCGGVSTTGATASALGGVKDAPIVWVIGSDSAIQVPRWQDQSLLQECVSFLVVTRPGLPRIVELNGFRPASSAEQVSTESGLYWIVDQKMLLLSSTEVRRQASAGMYINGLVPYSVYAYIRSHSLYFDKREVYNSE